MACAGAEYVVHAEAVAVPVNLVAKIPSESVLFEDAALATVGAIAMHGFRLGEPRLKSFGGGRSAVLDDFRTLELWSDGRRKIEKSHLRQDKGHRGECEAFVRAIKGGAESPIAFESLVNPTLTTFRLAESVRQRRQPEVSWNTENVDETGELSPVMREGHSCTFFMW